MTGQKKAKILFVAYKINFKFAEGKPSSNLTLLLQQKLKRSKVRNRDSSENPFCFVGIRLKGEFGKWRRKTKRL